jgi:formylglycine-generating enzyme required for sulfatase activity
MGTQANPPSSGAGARRLNGTTDGGWDSAWNAKLPADTTALIASVKCTGTGTWTDAPGANEAMPISCVTWYEAFAFCVWDAGFLPTDAEWGFVSAGGIEQRAYPWSMPPDSLSVDCSYANYYGPMCTANTPTFVGETSPKGDGKWGHVDLGGNVHEWTLDWFNGTYINPCYDCAQLTAIFDRVTHGGSSSSTESSVRTGARLGFAPNQLGFNVGVRCARAP